MSHHPSRRQIIKQIGVAGATLPLLTPRLVRAQDVKKKNLNVGFIATGGRAKHTIEAFHKMGLNCVAFADVDSKTWHNVQSKPEWQGAKSYTDWRRLFEKHHKEIDLVAVCTPDHSHYAPTMTAISMGIHCYTEKPLTWSVREAQLLTAAYKKNTHVVTQMGNQGHAGYGWRVAYDFIKAGALGDILEFHTWTNRPVWPQGRGRPVGEDPVPANLNWDAWIGAAPMRPFKKGVYHGFVWRGFVDFGSGALGDMGCHTQDGMYAIMDPGYAQTVEPIYMSSPCGDQFPIGMTIKSTFGAKAGRPGFTAYWYEGKNPQGQPNKPPLPEEMAVDGRKLGEAGNIIVGTKGKMHIGGSYWDSPRLIPEARQKEFGRPKQLLERSPGHVEEFIMACRGEKPREFSRSNFSYSGPMSANIQLGNVAARAGKKIEVDPTGKITSDPRVNNMEWREPRPGWGPMETNI